MNLIVDFLLLGLLAVAMVGLFVVLTSRRPDNSSYKYALGMALAAALFLVWSNGAVGIIGPSANDANLMYYGVLALGLVGALLAQFRPRGMARVLLAMGLAQVLVPVIALAFGIGPSEPVWSWDVLILTGFFATLWSLSAWQFRRAASRGTPPPEAAPAG